MRKEMAISIMLLLLLVGGLSLLAWPPTSATQSSDRKSSKKEDFGASLKRLKWDPKKQAAEEMKRGNHETSLVVGPGDVIKNEERDGRLRKVQVETPGHPEYVVHGRRSYYLMPR